MRPNIRTTSPRLAAVAAAAGIMAFAVPSAASAAVTPSVNGNELTLTSDAASDNITLTVAGGNIAHNLPIAGGIANNTDFDPGPGTINLPSNGTVSLVVNAGAGNDNVNVSAPTFAGNPALNGGDGDDIILGSPQVDVIDGGLGNDRITAFRGNETINGGDGNDTIIWNNGDGNDVNVGGAGNDETLITTGNADDDMTVTQNGARFLFSRINAAFTVDSDTTEKLIVTSFSGNDRLVTGAGVTVPMTIDAGTGDDSIATGDGADLINGGDGNDVLSSGLGGDRIVGDRGADTMNGSGGDDTLVWNNGDGSDVMNGDDGVDRIETNLGAGDDVSTLRVENGRVRYDRTSAGAFNLSVGSAETFELNSLGGNDTLTSSAGLPITLVTDGGAGNDTFNVRDGAASFVFGGSGADMATVDAPDLDAVAADVETVNRPAAPPAAGGTANPPAAGAARLARTARVRRGVATVRVSCPAASSGCRGTVTLFTTKARRSGRLRAALVLGRQSFRVNAGRSRTIRIRLAAGTRTLAKRKRLTVSTRIVSRGSVERTGRLSLRF
jgi:Ca2+-binding RTX toxin-like protein